MLRIYVLQQFKKSEYGDETNHPVIAHPFTYIYIYMYTFCIYLIN